ncbi:TIGR03619 family F420-dependent LLM class oxidoreductase [Nocardia salmonicida]|uniref:TIGR03619 family F420-dependent LLM class oxidoreductase n=1 Tax=Nocardia salmonicida TaxID=53431 RepID=UPI00366E3924
MTQQEGSVEVLSTARESTAGPALRLGFGALGNRPDEIVELARYAESVGFARIWFGDHLCQPAQQDSKYPYGSTALTLTTVDYLDPLVQAAAIAGATRTIEIATAVFLLPMHHPLVIARALLTLQAAARDRFVFGVGVGWMPEEFATLGVPFERRGRRMDESLEILRAARTGEPIEYHGSEFDFESLTISHRPLSVPLIVGGASNAALRRAARLGDGWVSSPDLDRDGLLRARDRIEAWRTEYGTKDRPFTYYVRLWRPDPELADRLMADGFTEFNIGTVDLFPRDKVASMSHDEKCAALDGVARDFGLTAAAI